jgi:hypothetical protein
MNRGEIAIREIRVAGPAAFVVPEALSFRNRVTNKDAYDLVHVLLNYGFVALREVAGRFAPIAHAPKAQRALTILAEDFATDEHVGSMRRAEILGNRDDPHLQQDAAGAVPGLLELVREDA